jgi:hypothetical protein
MRPYDGEIWGCSEAGVKTHLSDDETVAKMGHPACRHHSLLQNGQLIISSSVELASSNLLIDASPLLEEEANSLLLTLPQEVLNPRFLYRSRAPTALSSHNDPVDTREIDGSETLK